MILLFLSFSFASTYNLPSAVKQDPGLSFGLGGGSFIREVGVLPSHRFLGSASFKGVQSVFSSTTYWGVHQERFDVLGLSYSVVERERFILAPYLMGAAFKNAYSTDQRQTIRAGLSFCATGRTFVWDASLSLYGLGRFVNLDKQDSFTPLSPLDTALSSELGMSYFIEQHQIRLGLLGPMPMLRHIWSYNNLSLESSLATLGTQHIVQVDVRYRQSFNP